MMVPFADLKLEYEALKEELDAAVDRVFKSGWFILGDEVRSFESEFAHYLNSKHAIGVGNGTDAIQLALKAFDVGPGDEVITVANTCVPTLTGICATGARPVLVDVHWETALMNPDLLEAAITNATKAIVPVHLYGHPCDMDAINSIAKPRNIRVIEDCAQAHGAAYNGRKCGEN